MNQADLAQISFTFATFFVQNVIFIRVRPQNFPSSSYSESFFCPTMSLRLMQFKFPLIIFLFLNSKNKEFSPKIQLFAHFLSTDFTMSFGDKTTKTLLPSEIGLFSGVAKSLQRSENLLITSNPNSGC